MNNFADRKVAMSAEEPTSVSLEELSRHNGKHDCWVAVHNKVWDVTEFLDEHPGGAESTTALLRSLSGCSG